MRILMDKRVEGVGQVILVPGRRTGLRLMKFETRSKGDLRSQVGPAIEAIDGAERAARSRPVRGSG